jgi:hypothetical protein
MFPSYGEIGKKEKARDDLNTLLRRLGIRSARSSYFGGALSEAELQAAFNRIQSDYGKPDCFMMDAQTLAAMKNLK